MIRNIFNKLNYWPNYITVELTDLTKVRQLKIVNELRILSDKPLIFGIFAHDHLPDSHVHTYTLTYYITLFNDKDILTSRNN